MSFTGSTVGVAPVGIAAPAAKTKNPVFSSLTVPQVSAVQIQSVLAEYLNLISATSYLNTPEKVFIKNLNLVEETDFLQQLATVINTVLKDGVVDSRDIPEIVLGTSNLIHSQIIGKSLANIDALHVLKFILTSLLNNNLIPIPTNQIDKAQSILENSFILLEIALPKKTGSFCPCF